ncbi:alkyl/aryl-sulfatase [Shewanella sp. UCD-KL12]|uniref:alkyl/aryl-sulfatase n=1 Tax=Shewanella sp. UCD-KL12 TaxID=1917163 RepID=UPI001C4BDDC6|nr:alkyl sulfatase dimerization domain-containing protein [Shewanella sp. UCD-KL12]
MQNKMMKKTVLAASIISLISFNTVAAHSHDDSESHNHEHEHINAAEMAAYQGKAATKHTTAANKALAERLPFSDMTAFEQQKRGLIAAFGDHDAGKARLQFSDMMQDIDPQAFPDTVNPSIFRQGLMNYQAEGLYEVVDGVYQIRGNDIANITVFKTDSGYVINDPGFLDETTKLAWQFAKQHLPAPHTIHAVIYSHPHGDHFGGVRGLSEDFADDVKIVAADGFVQALADENMLAGNAMSRRSNYQYGVTLGKDAHGTVDNAIGLTPGVVGGLTLITPTLDITDKIEKHVIDGVEFEFTNVPGAEAPVEIITWVEKYKTLFTGELTYHGMHNIYTFRGAKVRDALAWSKYLTDMKLAYGDRIEALTSSHSAPVWETADINEYITLQRDNYGFIHNQALRLANHGTTINDVGREIDKIIPEAQFNTWHTNGYHGSYSHNARAVVNLYLGYHDLNPVNTNPLTSQDKSCVYVETAGVDTLMKGAQARFDKGEYQAASQLVNDVVLCDPNNQAARNLLADSFEQQGYQSETMAWRNSYLSGAYELRTNVIHESIKQNSADIVANSPTLNILDYLAVRLNAPKAVEAGLTLSFNLVHPDTKEYFYSEISNGNMANVSTSQEVAGADATFYINKADLASVMIGETTLAELLKSKQAGIKGQQDFIQQIMPTLDTFSPLFEILPIAQSK